VHKKYRKLLFALGVLLIIIGVVFSFFAADVNAPQPSQSLTTIRLSDQTFQTEIADTDTERRQGLGGRQGIAENEAMLFVFDSESDQYCFWMKDVNFPLDIMWFDDQKQFVDAVYNLDPATYPETFCPESAARYVIEVKGGVGERLRLTRESRFDAQNL